MLKVSCFFFAVHDFSLEITNENISEHSCPYFFFISMIMILSAFCFPTVPRRTSSAFASSAVPFFNSRVVVLCVVEPALFTVYFTMYWSAYTDMDINAAHSNKTIFLIISNLFPIIISVSHISSHFGAAGIPPILQSA